jgi:hypothetical protein
MTLELIMRRMILVVLTVITLLIRVEAVQWWLGRYPRLDLRWRARQWL